MTKRKPINPAYRNLSEKSVSFSDSKISSSPNLLLETILAHRDKSTCENCSWHVTVLGFLDVQEIVHFRKKNCFLDIHFDLFFLRPEIIQELKDRHGFKEYSGLKPHALTGEGIIMVYCE